MKAPMALLEEMALHGVMPSGDLEIIADGRWHAFHVGGDRRGRENGRYVCDGTIPLFVTYGTFKMPGWHSWREERQVTAAEARAQREWQSGQRRKRDAEDAARRGAAAARAAYLWANSRPADPAHPYLQRKGIAPHGLHQRGDLLLVPMRDFDGQLHSLQFINREGEKNYLNGGRASGSLFVIGNRTPRVWVAEGVATGATLHEASGEQVVVAFSAGNLQVVAAAILRAWRPNELAIMADDDQKTTGNPGVTAAKKAAAAVGCEWYIPQFPPGDTGGGDFNDAWLAWRARRALG